MSFGRCVYQGNELDFRGRKGQNCVLIILPNGFISCPLEDVFHDILPRKWTWFSRQKGAELCVSVCWVNVWQKRPTWKMDIYIFKLVKQRPGTVYFKNLYLSDEIGLQTVQNNKRFFSMSQCSTGNLCSEMVTSYQSASYSLARWVWDLFWVKFFFQYSWPQGRVNMHFIARQCTMSRHSHCALTQ